MNFLKNMFINKKKTNANFWNWFQIKSSYFHKIVKENKNVEANFFKKLSPKLNEVKEGYFFLTGMLDEDTAESL